jgi:hypothetical protein
MAYGGMVASSESQLPSGPGGRPSCRKQGCGGISGLVAYCLPTNPRLFQFRANHGQPGSWTGAVNGLYGEVHSVTEFGHSRATASRIWHDKRALRNVNESLSIAASAASRRRSEHHHNHTPTTTPRPYYRGGASLSLRIAIFNRGTDELDQFCDNIVRKLFVCQTLTQRD